MSVWLWRLHYSAPTVSSSNFPLNLQSCQKHHLLLYFQIFQHVHHPKVFLLWSWAFQEHLLKVFFSILLFSMLFYIYLYTTNFNFLIFNFIHFCLDNLEEKTIKVLSTISLLHWLQLLPCHHDNHQSMLCKRDYLMGCNE